MDIGRTSAAKYAKMANLYAAFQYVLKDDPTNQMRTAICKYVPRDSTVKVEDVIKQPLVKVGLSYFHAVAGLYPSGSRQKGTSQPKLSAIKPGQPGSILKDLTPLRWMPGYDRSTK